MKTGPILTALMLVVAAVGVACGNDDSPGSGVGGSAGTAAEAGGASGSAGSGGDFTPCSEGCLAPSPPDCTEVPDARDTCMTQCEDLRLRVPDACAPSWNLMIECINDAITNCRSLTSGACEAETEAVVDCAAAEDPCFVDHGGSAWSREGVSVSVHLEACGCEPPDGAAVGTACSEGSECAELCCECPTVSREHGVRACIEGQCAGAADACAEAFSHTPSLCEAESEG
jgi:hypothetical protein